MQDISTNHNLTVCGTPSWTAPEVMKHQRYTVKADIYSMGICFWEMWHRTLPYDGIAPYQVVIGVATKVCAPFWSWLMLEGITATNRRANTESFRNDDESVLGRRAEHPAFICRSLGDT